MQRFPKFPLQTAPDGRTATVERDRWIRDLLEAFLFTNPGERLNRPEFGSGLLAMIFAGNHATIAGALDASLRAAIEQHFSHLIDLEDLTILQQESLLEIEVQYRTRPDGVRKKEVFRQEITS